MKPTSLLSIVLLACVTGCSSFDKQWQAALSPEPPQGVVGAWEGEWRSHAGHGRGRLLCVFTQVGENKYLARFKATYWGWAEFEYEFPMDATPAAEGIAISGREDLGWTRGGVYAYQGEVNVTDFKAEYRSQHDRGVFEMKRAAFIPEEAEAGGS